MNIGLFGIMLIFMVIGWAVSRRLKSKFKEYTNVPTSNGMSGAEVAEIMLKENNIFDVEITCVPGSLTDHYNPQNKTINLSNDVYNGRNVAAAAVAAHETGHAVQHATAYSMLQLRSTLVPVVQFSSKMMNYIFMA
ncbi:MAG: zinc metallopeptidase, partial [Flavobacteriales bacterium]|nr:zinc metallopeptidase [Flavobacteriales bacterium]